MPAPAMAAPPGRSVRGRAPPGPPPSGPARPRACRAAPLRPGRQPGRPPWPADPVPAPRAPDRPGRTGPGSLRARRRPRAAASSMASGTGNTDSPGTSRRSLLVVSMRTRRHCSASITTARPADPRTCSQLSSTISSSRSASARTTPAIGSAASRSGTPSASATSAGTSAGSVREASSTSRAPSPKLPSASVATRSASRVLPHPPGPVNVTTRPPRSRSRTAAISRPRPTSELTSVGNPDCRCRRRDVCVLLLNRPGRYRAWYDPANCVI